MKMEMEMVELRILKPEVDGNWLTNGETYSQTVYLGVEDSPENWNEISSGEYAAAMNS